MLALKLLRDLEARFRSLGLMAQDALDRPAGIRLVTFADPALRLWRLPTRYAEPQREVIDQLPSLPAPRL